MEKGWISPEFTIKSTKGNISTIYGYASVFNIVDSHNDIIDRGAFKSAKARDIKFLWQHDVKVPIGVVKYLEEDEYGLKIEAEINNLTQSGFEAVSLIKQGAVCGLSVGFSIKHFDYNKSGCRVIKDAELAEVSVVTFPANIKAEITNMKSAKFKNNDKKDAEILSNIIDKLKLAII